MSIRASDLRALRPPRLGAGGDGSIGSPGHAPRAAGAGPSRSDECRTRMSSPVLARPPGWRRPSGREPGPQGDAEKPFKYPVFTKCKIFDVFRLAARTTIEPAISPHHSGIGHRRNGTGPGNPSGSGAQPPAAQGTTPAGPPAARSGRWPARPGAAGRGSRMTRSTEGQLKGNGLATIG